jgi:transposase
VISGGGGRRRWSDDEKARAIEASMAPGVVISEVARVHGVTPQQLFGWRRDARRKVAEASEGQSFATVIVNAADAGGSRRGHGGGIEGSTPTHDIELDIGGANVWIWRGADPMMVTAIIGALKAIK